MLDAQTMSDGQVEERRGQGRSHGATGLTLSSVAAAWTDRSGRFSWLRLAVFLLALCPALWLFAAVALGAAGARPIETALDVTGVWTVRFLILSLAVTPVRRIFGWTRLAKVRRMLGLTAAIYAGLHFSLFVARQNFDVLNVASEIASRIYLGIGFIAFLGIAALAVTSTDRWIKTLGPRWARLHQLVYPIAALGLLHFLMQSKFDVRQAVFYVGVFALLMAYRALPRWGVNLTPTALAALALLAIPATMALEIGWHAMATSAALEFIWRANFEFAGAVAPAWQVGIIASTIAVGATLKAVFKKSRAAA